MSIRTVAAFQEFIANRAERAIALMSRRRFWAFAVAHHL
jgi:hypothetical protein